MTSQGTARGRFGRAIRDRHLRRAEIAARELGHLSLDDALVLCELIADFDPSRYERAPWGRRADPERVPESCIIRSSAKEVLGKSGG